ncbi:MAG: tetratricopeptide repeat protein [Sulfuriferula sp.]|nr:tetratricopeptide repeat protein [Sulfuriferula sp.]
MFKKIMSLFSKEASSNCKPDDFIDYPSPLATIDPASKTAEALKIAGDQAINSNKLEDALDYYRESLKLIPHQPKVHNNLGIALYYLKRLDEALISYNHAITLDPNNAQAHNNRGLVLYDLDRSDEALLSYARALEIKPDYAESYNNRGLTLNGLNYANEALMSFQHALALKPNYAEAYNNQGVALKKLERLHEALISYEHALALKSDYTEAFVNKGLVLDGLARLDEALISYEHAFALNPDFEYLYGSCLFLKKRLCNWDELDYHLVQAEEKIQQGEKAVIPFIALGLSNNRAIQKKSAETFTQNKFPLKNHARSIVKRAKRDKIRVGYFSADFCNHAVSILTAELFEVHDRANFDIIAFSFGTDSQDATRARLKTAFDQFIDVHDQTDQDIVTLSRNMEIDIAIDLGGLSGDCRPGIFALRAAPLQVNYLGYPGTMGAEYIDYIIADDTIIPPTHQIDYTEKVIYLPSFQVNDTKRLIANKVFTRESLNLPASGFVFCCFNNNYKINPHNFDSWMRILQRVEGSVLWLIDSGSTYINNLTKAAVLRGVDPKRLVFAQRVPLSEYLARYRAADLFLDTLPYNAGTTTSDALWAGLPVLTCLGETFAGRMAASLLNAIHLPELITTTQAEYENLAVSLAKNPDQLLRLKASLANNRLTTPLFDTQQFTHNIESAYRQIYERYHLGLPPAHIYVNRY